MKRVYFFGGAALAAAVAIAMGTGVMTGCGKKKSGGAPAATALAEGSAITISGSLAVTGTGTSLSLTGASNLVDLATLKVYCVSFSVPPVAGTGTVNADGSFSLTLAAAQVAVGCFILDSTDSQLGSIVFENPSKKNMDGTNKSDSKQAFSGATNLGAISLDLDTGKAVVDVSKITTVKETTTAQASAFDFTGRYKITAAGITLPPGYTGTCAEGARDCRGPTEGEILWVKRVAGKSTADASPVYGIMVWASEQHFQACGGTLGITNADAMAHAGVDFTGSDVPAGLFRWDDNYVEGWKYSGATARNDLMVMENVADFKGYPGTKQYFSRYRTMTCDQNVCTPTTTATAGFMFNANTNETGCKVVETGRPHQLNDWSNMPCTTPELLPGGLHKNTCAKSVTDVGTVRCVHIGGAFTTAGASIPNAHAQYPDDFAVLLKGPYCETNNTSGRQADERQPQWDNDGKQTCPSGTLVAGELCSGLSTPGNDQEALLQLRCYADSLWQTGKNASGCVRNVTTNWSAKTSGEFIENNGPDKAMSQMIFEQFNFDSANSGSFANEEIRYEGIQDGNNWTDCKVIERFSMSLRKIDGSSDLLAEMIQETRNASPKPACIAKYGTPETMKSIFKFVKQ